MEALKTIEFEDGAKLELYQDIDPMNPREWDNFGTMICFHKRYILGDKHDLNSSNFNSWDEIKEHIEHEYHPAVILPLYLMDHSGLSMRTSSAMFRAVDSVGWDWGQVGFIFVSREKVLKEYGCKRITKKIREKVEQNLQSEVEIYDQYLTGDIYYFNLVNPDGDVVDGCGGFFGGDLKQNGILDHLPEQYREEAARS